MYVVLDFLLNRNEMFLLPMYYVLFIVGDCYFYRFLV